MQIELTHDEGLVCNARDDPFSLFDCGELVVSCVQGRCVHRAP